MLVYLRASLPSVPIQTLHWIVLVKKRWRRNTTMDLQSCLFVTMLFVLQHCFLFPSSSDFRHLNLSQHVYSQGVFIWIFFQLRNSNREKNLGLLGWFSLLGKHGISWAAHQNSVLPPPSEATCVALYVVS